MSDILFLSVKEHAGKLKNNEGVLAATGTLATLTATSGKDMYLARAKISADTSTAGGTVKVELQANGTVIETALIRSSGTTDASEDYEFVNIGHKVSATQVIKLEVISITNVTVEGTLECFEENTGESPFQSAEFS